MIDSDVILKVENLSKQYRLGLIGTGTISHDLNRWWNKIKGKEDPYLKIGESNDRSSGANSDYVWALRDINFEVNRGEVLGIIGKNGAGKSTLLKILSRVTSPTLGTIKSNGRIASLLEVGTGFHPEMTGRENVYLNGAILGMTRAEITTKIDEIIEFSGCLRYIDTPVKRYSSGMTVRLAFAVAAHLEPDILVVDEVLAVGDAEFQKKAIGKMQDISKGQGRTVLFVSHNMASVKSLCTKAIVLEHGQVAFAGNVEDSLDYYLNNTMKSSTSLYINEEPNEGSDILEVKVLKKDELADAFGFNESVSVSYKIKVEEEDLSAKLGFKAIDQLERVVFTSNTLLSEVGITNQGTYTIRVAIPNSILLPSHYRLAIGFHIHKKKLIRKLDRLIQFKIEETGSGFETYQKDDMGCVLLDCKWESQNTN
ncbi:MAG: ABC transporter ATP-binding protein [Winogradskyella sp.]|uniref:ABC transporter ATP-binding protein n=1 Tax=Winogradskyella sp. TaxID=1883156 RepID=UPI002600E86A|nr:ABC transporter ATP-binding protein [Winogradskyella sp.]NRB59424.1 ABC transporter ATP-binding protein [Winogradskyella sp.]